MGKRKPSKLPPGVPHQATSGPVDAITGDRARAAKSAPQSPARPSLAPSADAPAFEAALRRCPEHLAHGRRVLLDTIASCQPSAVALQLLRTESVVHSVARTMGAAQGACELLDQALAAGYRVNVTLPKESVALRRLMAVRGVARLAALDACPLEEKADAVELLLTIADSLVPIIQAQNSRELQRRAAEATQAAPAPAPVVYELRLPEGPIPMAIVEQPAMYTQTTVSKDSAGRITGSTATTRPL